MSAVWIILNRIASLFNLSFQRVGLIISTSLAQFITLMRKCQNICGDSMMIWLCRHILYPFFSLRMYCPATNPAPGHHSGDQRLLQTPSWKDESQLLEH